MNIIPKRVTVEPDKQSLKPSLAVLIEFFAEGASDFRVLDSRAEASVRSEGVNWRVGWLSWMPQDPQEEYVKKSFFTLSYALTLDHYVLDAIEQLIGAGDIEFFFNGSLLVGKRTSVITEIISKSMQAGRWIPEDWKSSHIYEIERHPFRTSFPIPRSTWANVVSEIGLEKITLVEIRFPKQKNIPILEEAFGRRFQATQKFRMGEYKGAVIECREALEAIEKLKELGGRNVLSEAIEQRKYEKVRDLLAKTRDLCGIAGHETQTGVEILRSDARFTIQVVQSILEYVNAALS